MFTESPIISNKNETSLDSIKSRVTQIIGFSGLLLGLLVNAITTIKFNEYSYSTALLIKLSFLITTFCLTVSVVIGIMTYVAAPKSAYADNPSEGVLKAVKWFLTGFFILMFSIPLILFTANENYWSCVVLTIYGPALLLALKCEFKKAL